MNDETAEPTDEKPNLWRKGMPSPNPAGRPKQPRTVAEVRALSRQYTVQMVEVLSRVALNPKSPPAARVAAASALIDRGWGRAPSGEFDGAEGLIIKVVRFTNEQLGEPDLKVIEGEVLDHG